MTDKGKRWSVEYGMAGYMPDTYEVVGTKTMAIEYALELLDNGEGAPRGAKTALRRDNCYHVPGVYSLHHVIIDAVTPDQFGFANWSDYEADLMGW